MCSYEIIFLRNWSDTMNIWFGVWILMFWCFSTRASEATVLFKPPCISSCLWVNILRHEQHGRPLWPLPCCIYLKKHKIYLHFLSLLNTEMSEIVEILPYCIYIYVCVCVRECVRKTVYILHCPVPWLLMPWWFKEPDHHQHGINLVFPEYSGVNTSIPEQHGWYFVYVISKYIFLKCS